MTHLIPSEIPTDVDLAIEIATLVQGVMGKQSNLPFEMCYELADVDVTAW